MVLLRARLASGPAAPVALADEPPRAKGSARGRALTHRLVLAAFVLLLFLRGVWSVAGLGQQPHTSDSPPNAEHLAGSSSILLSSSAFSSRINQLISIQVHPTAVVADQVTNMAIHGAQAGACLRLEMEPPCSPSKCRSFDWISSAASSNGVQRLLTNHMAAPLTPCSAMP